MAKYPADLLTLMAFLRKLPGVGSRTAERFAFHLLTWPEEQLRAFGEQLGEIKNRITHCAECHCLMDQQQCAFCDQVRKESAVLCVISSAKDVFALEETKTYRGLYHVLGGLLSPMDGRHPSHLQLDPLKNRITSLAIKEVILAFDSTLEGDATALYLKEELAPLGVTLSRLAFGLPMGSSLDFIDGGTLSRALTGRLSF